VSCCLSLHPPPLAVIFLTASCHFSPSRTSSSPALGSGLRVAQVNTNPRWLDLHLLVLILPDLILSSLFILLLDCFSSLCCAGWCLTPRPPPLE
jgi:hypothetical protein